MSAAGPYSQSLDYTHMYDFNDINGIYPLIQYQKNSITDFLNSNNNFCKFNQILKLSGMVKIFDDKQANFTLFITPDIFFTEKDDIFLSNMDRSTAINIIKSNSLKNKITTDLFKSTMSAYYYTQNNPDRRLISIISNDIIIDNYAKLIKGDVSVSNGLIHIIDKLIYPDF